LGSWKISYELKDFKLDKPEILVDDVVFHVRENQPVGTVTIHGNEIQAAIKEAKQVIDRAVNELCYICEKSISMTNNLYIVDQANPRVTGVQGEFVLMRDIGMDSIQDKRSSMLKMFDPNQKEILNKVLGLYKNGLNSLNPFNAIETFFSCIQAILNDMFFPGCDLKKGLKDILSSRNKNFNEKEFYNKFAVYYGKTRSQSTHGNLDVSDHRIQEQTVNDLREFKIWTWEVLDEFVTRNQINPEQ
jgi:hypothetical protein